MARLVRHASEMKPGARVDAFPKKAVEDRRRRGSVEASVVKT
jgi:hypothetical protein